MSSPLLPTVAGVAVVALVKVLSVFGSANTWKFKLFRVYVLFGDVPPVPDARVALKVNSAYKL